ncbi:energy transducer TonB [Hymenobacter sp. DH14]|uniref:Energy transducer TonB n=1 Tax=Hymenobacter cyanobacteriorum TaxID=2926463 RepID=A0A9X1VKQ8_9BACT|nr:energy transducer TonB [Hymenobacter cyanobacteriorum]MCI1188006.1 energy transducer TonB [Hymenobacter cyanobacteriorum]
MMTNAQLATASLDDIVFDGRNRHYGAYQLRAMYQRHMTRALVIATAILALILVFPLVAQLLAKAAPVAKPVIVDAKPENFGIEAVVPPIAPPPPVEAVKPPTTAPQPPTIQNLVPVVAKDDKVNPDNKVPDQKDLEGKESGVRTIEGDPGAGPTVPNDLPPGKDNGVVPEVAKPYTFVEQMPELPGGGGQLAIVVAIQKAVRYPSMALRNGVEGKVFVSFVVDPKGEVTDVKIVKGLGSGLDEETIRAIKTLPRFIPGKQNGREVSVAFTVPVTYKIQ